MLEKERPIEGNQEQDEPSSSRKLEDQRLVFLEVAAEIEETKAKLTLSGHITSYADNKEEDTFDITGRALEEVRGQIEEKNGTLQKDIARANLKLAEVIRLQIEWENKYADARTEKIKNLASNYLMKDIDEEDNRDSTINRYLNRVIQIQDQIIRQIYFERDERIKKIGSKDYVEVEYTTFGFKLLFEDKLEFDANLNEEPRTPGITEEMLYLKRESREENQNTIIDQVSELMNLVKAGIDILQSKNLLAEVKKRLEFEERELIKKEQQLIARRKQWETEISRLRIGNIHKLVEELRFKHINETSYEEIEHLLEAQQKIFIELIESEKENRINLINTEFLSKIIDNSNFANDSDYAINRMQQDPINFRREFNKSLENHNLLDIELNN